MDESRIPEIDHSNRVFRHRTAAMVAALALVALFRGADTVAAGENYAFLVAVADYDEKELRPLKFTRSDILDFHAALLASGFKNANIVLMHDDLEKLVAHYRQLGTEFKPVDYVPDREKIRTELALMLGTLRSDDSVIVAFAGHGVQFAGQKKSYFCPKDARLDNAGSLIEFDEIYNTLAQSRAGRKMLLVDACQNDPQTALSRSRSTVDLDSVTRIQEEAVPEGVVALFSCTAGQKSFEYPPLGHGIFFYHVLEGWNGKADIDGNNKLSYRELADYTERETALYAKKNLKALQVPTLRSDFNGEWVLREFTATKTIGNSLGMKLVYLEGGSFLMGYAEAPPTGDNRQHRVRITKPFYIGAHEVTVGQFRAFAQDTNYNLRGGMGYNSQLQGFQFSNDFGWSNTGWPQTENSPVVNVNWNTANDFCRWLSRRENANYRLPTEAEWEFACRAGSQTGYFWGESEDVLAELVENKPRPRANVADSRFKTALAPIFNQPNYYDYSKPWDDGFAFTAPVGSFQPNGFGLYDMHGNVQEWCSDWYGEFYYRDSPTNDPQGPAAGDTHVKRGGDYVDYAVCCRSDFRRSEMPPNNVSHFVGFRVVRDAK